MNNALRISLFANLLLGMIVLWMVEQNRSTLTPANARAVASNVEIRSETASAGQEEKTDDNRPEFRWSQLESTDYRVYIANLRRIGCPEQTIRDIITADLTSVYAARRSEPGRMPSVQSLTQTNSFALADVASPHAADAESQQLRGEEASVISALLDPSTSSFSGVNPERTLRLKPAEPATPLVYQDADLTPLNLTPGQIEAINYLRQKFQEEIGGPNANPNDPAYRQRWQRAQSESDSLLLAILGSDDYGKYQMLTAGRSR